MAGLRVRVAWATAWTGIASAAAAPARVARRGGSGMGGGRADDLLRGLGGDELGLGQGDAQAAQGQLAELLGDPGVGRRALLADEAGEAGVADAQDEQHARLGGGHAEAA